VDRVAGASGARLGGPRGVGWAGAVRFERATSEGSLDRCRVVPHVAVTSTPCDGTASRVEVPAAVRLLAVGSDGATALRAPAPWAASGATRIASVRPTAWAGQR